MEETTREYYRLTYAIDGKACYAEMVEKGSRLASHPKVERPHYVFSGWGEVPPRMPDCDFVIDGHFTPILYRGIFASGVVQYGMVDAPIGTPIKAPPTPVSEGQDFVEWRGYDGVMPGENVVFEAVFAPRTYVVEYRVDDTIRIPFEVEYGAPFPMLEEPKKKNCVFSGWSVRPATMPAHDVIVTGHFSEKLYRLTRIVDGEVFSVEMLPCGAKVDRKTKPTKDGYYFSGWRKLPETMPAEDVEVVASMYPARYRVDFFVNEELYQTSYVPYGEPIVPPPSPDEAENLFGGWDNLPATMPAHDLHITGSLTARLYSLNYVADGMPCLHLDLPVGATLPKEVDVPSKEGYAFCGWDKHFATMPAHDLTLNAVYATVRSHYVFMIDDTIYAEIDPQEAEDLVMPLPPARDGEEFSGWNGVKVDPRTGVTVFSGTYGNDKKHTITYLIREELYSRQTLGEGDPIVPPTVEENESYEFLGWGELPQVMPPQDITVEGEIRTFRHRLNFVVEGETVYTMLLDEGDEVACPAVAPRLGSTFSGWENPPAVMPAHDVTVTGAYHRNVHTITFVIDGETVESTSLSYGDKVVLPRVPLRRGAEGRFLGWSPSVTTMPDRDVTLIGAYSDNHCLVDIYTDGVLHSTVRVKVDTPIPLPEPAAREGMEFKWQNVPEVVPGARLEVHGGWVPKNYSVTYVMDGETIGCETYAYGEAIKPKVEPLECDKGTFIGWQGLEERMPAHSLVVEPRYESRAFHVKFMLDDTLIWQGDVVVGTKIPVPEVPQKEGYAFSGWNNFVEVMPPYSFTAHGTYIRKRYTITFLDVDRVIETKEYVYGTKITPPEEPARQGLLVIGWEGMPRTMPARDLRISARYGGEKFRVSYLVEGELIASEEVDVGVKLSPPVEPMRDGYLFTGWQNMPEFMPDHDVIVTGGFGVHTYSVTYKVNGIIWRIDHYEPGEKITPPDPPEQLHETFVRWRNFTDTMPDYDFTCVAEYHEPPAHYTFVLDGEIVFEGMSRKGDTITAPPAPHRSGYAFTGWSGFTGIMPPTDVVYVGGYAIDRFQVRYMVNGELYEEEPYDEGEIIFPKPAPVKEGYVFGGWSHIPEVMPGDDVVVTGELIPNLYQLTYMVGDDVCYSKAVPCGTTIPPMEAPQIHGLSFGGWIGQPQVMPPHDVEVKGRYSRDRSEYKTLSTSIPFGNSIVVEKVRATPPTTIAFVSGSYFRLVMDNICYPVPYVSNYVRNSKIIDFDGFTKALANIYRKKGLPKRDIYLVFNAADDAEVTFPTPENSEAEYTKMAEALLRHTGGKKMVYHHHLMAESATEDKRYVFTSAYEEVQVNAFIRAFDRVGVKVSGWDTLMGAITAYLQGNRRMERGTSQIGLYYLPTTILGTLVMDGQVVCLKQNRYPYADRFFSLEDETSYIVRSLNDFAEKRGQGGPLTTVTIGGIDRTHVRACEKLMPRLLRSMVREKQGGLFKAPQYKRPLIVNLGFGAIENRTK